MNYVLVAFIVIVLLFVVWSLWGDKIPFMSQEQSNFLGRNLHGFIGIAPQGGPAVTDAAEALPINVAGEPATKMKERRVFWTIPREKNPDGGYDSITGWYDAVSPRRWDETWGNVF